ncbi:MAG: S8 family serine peptidase [Bryobacteraceae bacterium]
MPNRSAHVTIGILLGIPILFWILPSYAMAAVSGEWIVILNEAPVVERYPGRVQSTRAVAEPYRRHLQQVQASLRSQVESKNIRVTGSVQHIMNAIFVKATAEQAEALRSISGVKAVMRARRFHKNDQLTLSDVSGAWSAAGIGGQSNAGAGMKIAVVDSGIDQTHPSFQDNSLTVPAGFPKCNVQSDCTQFTNKKVIVARSYVSMMTVGSNASDPAADSRPDDTSARDLDGHGTAVASVAAGVSTKVNGVTLSGVAPKAFLGAYKIYGSPELNTAPTEAEILQAFDDAVSDGMDVVNFSSGAAAFGGPLDTGSACGNPAGQPCDALAWAAEQMVKNGQVLVVSAAGNEGCCYSYQNQNNLPTFGTIDSPASAPSALAAGGIQNDITYSQSVSVSGSNVPSNLQYINAFESYDGPAPPVSLTAPLIDATKAGDTTGLLCNALSGTPFNNSIALVARGSCNFYNKVVNAQYAGAVGVIFMDNVSGEAIFQPSGLSGTVIPAFMISQSDGQNLKTYIDANASAQVTMDPSAGGQIPAATLGYIPDSVAYFASRGPATGTNGLKPDVAAVATDFLLAAENYDPYGDLFSATRFKAADGTSFSTPVLAGAAALVKQANPSLTPLQIKSALVNTATLSGILDQSGTANASLSEVGSGLLQAQNAVVSTVQIVPSSVSFGLITGALPSSQTLTVSNSGPSRTLTFAVTQPSGLTGTQVKVDGGSSASLTVDSGQSGTVTVAVTGSIPAAGRWEGIITVSGGPVTLTVPYMFLVGDGIVYDVMLLNGGGFDGIAGQQLPGIELPLAIRAIDQYGAPVANAPVQWLTTRGTGSILSGTTNTTTSTDQNGIAYASIVLGPQLGSQEFTAVVNNIPTYFDGNARNVPVINPNNGIVDGAAFLGGRAVAPGSIISIFGTNLADYSDQAIYLPLPVGLDNVAFSFDVPSANISVPGRIYYVSPGQVNVQVPWELTGQSSATVKLMIGYNYSAEYTLPLATYSPGFFTYTLNTQYVAAALDLKYKLISTTNPAVRGSTVQIYLNGLGPVNSQPASGSTGPQNANATTTATPTITIGGQNATVSYSGLAPGYVGLYQVNAVVPDGISAGLQQITCSIGGVTCQSGVYLPVQ